MNIHYTEDIRICLLAFCSIAALTVLVLTGMRHMRLSENAGRKILHAGAIGICGYTVHGVADRAMLSGIFFVFFFLLWVVARQRILFRQDEKSYGIAFFALAFAVLLVTDIPADAIVYGAVVTAICDPMAGWAGQRWGRASSHFLFERKSWVGFGAFYVSCIGVSLLFVGWHPVVLLLALLPAIGELYSWRGSDNVLVPLLAAFWYYLLYRRPPDSEDTLFILGLVLAAGGIYRRRWLVPQAIPAALLLALLLYFAGGWQWVAVLTIFFAGGSLTSRLVSSSDDAGGRNARQVFANGGVAALCAVFYYLTDDASWLVAFLTSVATSMADTMSSDIGVRIGQVPVDIVFRHPTPKGMSGGVTLAGTAAGLAGSMVVAVAGSQLLPVSLAQTIAIVVLGFMGMLTDSIIGSLWQAKYRDLNGHITEREGKGMTLVRGRSAITNDAVNLLANLLVTSVAFAIAGMNNGG